MAEKVPGWLGRVLLPEIGEIKGELKALDSRVSGLEGKMDGEFRAVRSELRRVEEKLSGDMLRVEEKLGSDMRRVEEKLGTRIDELDKRLDVAQRLAVEEGQLKEVRGRS